MKANNRKTIIDLAFRTKFLPNQSKKYLTIIALALFLKPDLNLYLVRILEFHER